MHIPIRDEEDNDERRSRKFSFREMALLCTLLLNFGGLIWGAATMHSNLIQVQIAVDNLNRTAVDMIRQITDVKIEYNARIAVLESRQREQDARKGK
jgi:hypothetical protein